MNIYLDHESRGLILDALRLYKKQGVHSNNPIIDNIFTELQPTGQALNASMGDVVLWNGERYEVVHRHYAGEVEDPNDYVTIAPCGINYENENPDPSLWPWVRATELCWPGSNA